MKTTTIILAAGKGTRMRSGRPKVLHTLANKPILRHVYEKARQLPDNTIHVVIGHCAEQVQEAMRGLPINWIVQAHQLGTGHAVMQARDHIGDEDWVLILFGDVPLLKESTLMRLAATASQGVLAMLTVELPEPTGYGRIVRDGSGDIVRIVEEKDASADERRIREINSGIMAVNGGRLKGWLARLGNDNAQAEYYLTDVVAMAVADGVKVRAIHPDSADEVLGVNDRLQLAHLERVYQRAQADALMLAGVSLLDPMRFDLRGQVLSVGEDVLIDANVILEGDIRLGSRVSIGANCQLRNCVIGDDVEILPQSVLDGAVIGDGCRIGPFARVRPDTVLDSHVHVGNFVEIKKAAIGHSSKVNHLSYIGDAQIGKQVNVGAGTITCNYDGANKFNTTIEDGAFIGSDTQLIAPVTIGKNATIGAGSTISKDAPAGELTLSRARQVTVVGWQRPGKQEK